MKIKRWLSRAISTPLVSELSQELHLHPVTAQVLANRGIQSVEEAYTFLNPRLEDLPNPFLMKDMEKAVLCLEEALSTKRKIVIYGDYDVDGTAGSALLYLFLKEIGMETDVYIPHRIQEGYGLNLKALEHLKSQNYELVITVDNGISSVAEAKRAREIGLDLVIIDHHQVPPQVPFARAILNPKQIGCEYPEKELAAVGVVFQFCLALRSRLREKGFFADRSEPNLKKYLDLVTLGTIADMVPLTGLNRLLVKMGLEVLGNSKNIGIQALKEVSAIQGQVTAGQVGFRLGPRINAVGRLHSAKLGFDLLTTSHPNEARQLAQKLDLANRERQALQDEIAEQASQKVQEQKILEHKRSILVFDPSWHVGVMGIVASRLVERFHLPTLVGVQEGDEIRCSGRSITGFNLYEALHECAPYLQRFGGHRQAAGLHFEMTKKEAFWEAFDQAVRSQLKSEEDFFPSIRVDTELSFEEINEKLIEELGRLAPFGQANPEPIFLAKDLKVIEKRRVGSDHLRLKLSKNRSYLEAIGFGMAEVDFEISSLIQCVFSCQFNEWEGRKKVQLRLIDFPRSA